MRGVIIAGIGTDVGKTVVSAVVCEALGADYWKPVASGLASGLGDDQIVASLISDSARRIHGSTYSFQRPLSPHAAAAMEGACIEIDRFLLPETDRPLVVELAGGVLVPLTDGLTNMDLVARLDLPVVVVSRHYLGSINHTLLTLEALRARGASVMGILFNGEELPDTERIIERLGQVRIIGRVPNLPELTPEVVQRVSRGLRFAL